MRPTRARSLVLLVAGAAALGYLLALVGYAHLPPLPRSAFAGMFVLAVAEALLAPSIRARIAGRPRTRPIMPIYVARVAALAKASTVVGAVSVGVWLALLVFTLLNRARYRTAGDDAATSAISLVVAVGLLAAALVLERACRTPEPPTGATGDLPPPTALS